MPQILAENLSLFATFVVHAVVEIWHGAPSGRGTGPAATERGIQPLDRSSFRVHFSQRAYNWEPG